MIRKRIKSCLGIVLVGLFAAACAWAGRGQNRTNMTVESVLRQLDSEAKGFHSLSADVERTKVTVVVDDK